MLDDFSPIFEALEAIENALKQGAGGQKRKHLVDVLISLRNSMDEYIKHWLKFEEKVNALQQEYGLVLPDTLPEDFFDLLDDAPGTGEDRLPPAGRLPEGGPPAEQAAPAGGNLFLSLQNAYAIRSFRRGLGFWDLAMLEEAIAEFENLTRQEPDFIFGHLCLGLAFSQKKMYDQALGKLRLVLALSESPPLKALVCNAMGTIYAEQEKYARAIEEYRQALAYEPQWKEIYFNLGAAWYNMKNYTAAAAAFKQYLQAAPGDWETFFYLGKTCGYLGKIDEAIANLYHAYRLRPHEPKVLFELGIVYLLSGHQKRSVVFFRRMKELINYRKGQGLRKRL